MAEKWTVENNYIVEQNGEPILRIDQCCSYSSPIKPEVIAQIVREHNSHKGLVEALCEECHHCNVDENEDPEICGKCSTKAALAAAEVTE